MSAKPLHHIAFIPATGFDPDPLNPMPAQPGQKLRVSCFVIGDLQNIATATQRHIKFVLAGVDPGRSRDMLPHLRLSLPCDANLAFLQPSGPDEGPEAIQLRDDPKRSRAVDPTTGAPLRMAVRNGAFLSERCCFTRAR